MGVCRHRVNAPRYGVDTTKRSIHIKLEKGSTAADQKWKTRRKTTNYINYVKKRIILYLLPQSTTAIH